VESFDESWERQLKRTTEGTQFNHVESSFTPLHFADERLGFSQSLGELRLRQPGVDPCFPQMAKENPIFFGKKRFLHSADALVASVFKGIYSRVWNSPKSTILFWD
jgi:hypothetical protein